MISQMLLLIFLANSFGVEPARGWVLVRENAECDIRQGEIYLAASSGEEADASACQKSCTQADNCRSITYHGNSKWCSHFSTACEKLSGFMYNAVSYKLGPIATTAAAPPKTTAAPPPKTTAAPTTPARTTPAGVAIEIA